MSDVPPILNESKEEVKQEVKAEEKKDEDVTPRSSREPPKQPPIEAFASPIKHPPPAMFVPDASELVYSNEQIISTTYEESSRARANDGFYTGIPPFITEKNLQKFLNRIERESLKKNGKENKLPRMFQRESDPKDTLLRRFEPKYVTKYIDRVKPPPIFGEAPENHTPLFIIIHNLTFYDHFLFTKEDRICKLLQGTYNEYKYAIKNSKFHYYKHILTGIKNCIDDNIRRKDEIPSHLYYDFADAYMLLISEEYNVLLIEKQLYLYNQQLQQASSKPRMQLNAQPKNRDEILMGGYESAKTYLTDIMTKEVNYEKKKQYEDKIGLLNTMYQQLSKPAFALKLETISTDEAGQEVAKPEQNRLKIISQSKYIIQLWINNVYISSTKPLAIRYPTFDIEYKHLFDTFILRRPKQVRLDIYEYHLIQNKFIASISVPVMQWIDEAQKVHRLWTHSATLSCSSKETLVYKSNRASYKDQLCPLDPNRHIQMKIDVSVKWGESEERKKPHETTLPPQVVYEDTNRLKGANAYNVLNCNAQGIPDFATEKDFQELVALNSELADPYCPDNIELRKMAALLELHKQRGDLFRDDALKEILSFLNLNERFEKTRRHYLLRKRFLNPYLFPNRDIPLDDHDLISKEYAPLLVVDLEEITLTDISEDIFQDAFNNRKNYIKRVQQIARDMQNKQKSRITYQTLVKETTILPDLGSLFSSAFLSQLFTPRKRLRPKQEIVIRKTILPPKGETFIKIQIYRGQNLPVRTQDIPLTVPLVSPNLLDIENRVTKNDVLTSYVSVKFVTEVIYRTELKQGANPHWNQTLRIPYDAGSGDNAYIVEKIQDKLYVDVYDELRIRLPEQEIINIYSQKRESRFLGSVVIPFANIYDNGSIEGIFELRSPPFVNGYTYLDNGTEEEKQEAIKDDVSLKQNKYSNVERRRVREEKEMLQKPEIRDNPHIRTKNRSFIHMKVSLDPPLATPKSDEVVPERVNKELKAMADKWMKKVSSKHPKMDFNVFVRSMDGGFRFVTSYIEPQAPPPFRECEGQKPSTALLASFVSAVPFIEDAVITNGVSTDMWCTSKEFLDMAAGDWEEHAILLCNYFLYIDESYHAGSQYVSYIVIGKAIPEGNTVYVLRVNRDLSERILWNASSGLSYLTTDLNCPLKEIYVLVSHTNVYGNMQKYKEPWMMQYDLENTSQWLRFFNGDRDAHVLNNISCCQDSNPTYTEIPPDISVKLKDLIEIHLKEKFEEWRNGEPCSVYTSDPNIENLLREIEKVHCQLPNEYDSRRNLYQQSYKNEQRAAAILRIPYDSIESVDVAVKRTKVWDIYFKSLVHFYITVYIKPYYNNICSIWIFVGAYVTGFALAADLKKNTFFK